MAANPNELALSYLLALSSDIRTAVLLDQRGQLLASVPGPLEAAQVDVAAGLLESTIELREGSSEPIELDLTFKESTVYVLVSGELAMVCTSNRQALPGIVLYEMRSVLADIAGSGSRPLREAGA